jgi:hypothetical protein
MAADGKSEQIIFPPGGVATPVHQQSGSAPAMIKLSGSPVQTARRRRPDPIQFENVTVDFTGSGTA